MEMCVFNASKEGVSFVMIHSSAEFDACYVSLYFFFVYVNVNSL